MGDDAAEQFIPSLLLTEAYESGGEFAWPRDSALKVIGALTSRSIAILGGDVWLPTRPGPTIPAPIIYVWDVGRNPHECWSDFVKRANAEARSYVVNFAWSQEDVGRYKQEPYFNFAFQLHIHTW